MNLAAFTQCGPASYPGYVSINETDDGAVTLTVRTPGHGGTRSAEVTLSRVEFDRLLQDLNARASK